MNERLNEEDTRQLSVNAHVLMNKGVSDLRVDTAVVLGVVGNLGPFSPDDLAIGGDHTQLGDVDLDDCSLGQDSELCVQRVLRVLLDGQNGQLDGNGHFGAIKLAQTH